MKGTLKLKKTILINNKEVTELIYDTDEITIALMAEAEAHKLKLVGPEVVSVAETDNCYHLFLGMAACVAAMDKVIFEDLMRLKGSDLMELRSIGRSFTLNLDQKPKSADETSDEQQETIQESTTLH